jgi:hypothetical protein
MPKDGIASSVAEIAADAQRLVKLELELAKQEITELVKRNAIAIGMLAGAGLCMVFVLYSAVAAVVFAVMWFFFHRGIGYDALALGAVTLLWLAVAVVLGLLGKSRLVFKMPEATIQTIKDDVEWARTQIRPATR